MPLSTTPGCPCALPSLDCVLDVVHADLLHCHAPAWHRRGLIDRGNTMPALRLIFLATLSLGLAACATRPPASDVEATQEFNENNDPFEPANRVSFAISDGLDTYVLAPVARAYRYAIPGVIRRPIHNVLQNITTPVLFINDVAQTKPRRAGDTFMRFIINTTVGVGGVFDVATDWGYPFHDNDFGLTMALWGVPEGPFLFL